MRPRWRAGPATITLVRHAESIGNLANDRAHADHAEVLDLDVRDADVPLSETGREQAAALAKWLAEHRADRPTRVITSPYRRAAETARLAVAGLGLQLEVDERLRERDLGRFDGLTGLGIRARFPDEAERRRRVGKFYYQPPGGESWADVVLRVRSFLRDLADGFDDNDGAHGAEGERVWLVTHQAVIMAHRYVLEGLSEEEALEASRREPLPNTSLTTFVREGPGYRLMAFGDTAHVERTDAEVTREDARDQERQ